MRQSYRDAVLGFARRFRRDESGATVTMFAFAGVALIGMAGAVVDYGRLSKAHSGLQAATDAAALAAARLPSKDAATMRAAADKFFIANTSGMAGKNIQITKFDFQESSGTVTIESSGVLDTTLMSIMGFTTIGFSSRAAALKEVTGTVEMALVLDNTWSMSDSAGGGGSKIAVLKSAAKDLINTILAQGGTNVKIGIVPFADYVNVGVGNRNQSWMSVPADYSTTTTTPAVPYTCKTISTKQVCTKGAPKTCTSTTDGVVSTYDCTPQTCVQQPITPYQSCSGPTPAKTHVTNYKWYGCVLSRKSGELRLNDSEPTSPYTGFLGTDQRCLNPIVPLTSDKAVLTSAIDKLIINIGGYKPSTYIPGGLIWGVNVLSPTAPFAEAKAYDTANKMPRKAMVLMTDGANTMYFRASDGTHQNATNNGHVTTTNVDTTKICDYAKSKKIEVFTVAFAVTDVAAKTMLQGCATSAGHYYDATDAAALTAAFQSIGQSLTSLRLSQ